MHMSNWSLSYFDFIISKILHNCSFFLFTKFLRTFPIFSFFFTFTFFVIPFPLPYFFTPSSIILSIRNFLFSHLQPPFDQFHGDLWWWRQSVCPSIPVQECDWKGLHSAFWPLSVQLQGGLRPYFPRRKLQLFFTPRSRAGLKRAIVLIVQAGLRLQPWNGDYSLF